MKDLLRVQSLVKVFKDDWLRGSKQVLHEVNFGVAEGRTTGFVGVNGSGKTTTLMCIFGFIRPDSGRVLFDEKDLSIESRKHIGFLPERPQFHGFLTGYEFLKYHWNLSNYEGPDTFKKRADELLDQVLLGQAKHRAIRTYSKGMVQRLGLCQALLTRPKLLVLDEPMSGLDPDGRMLARRLIQAAAKEGTTIFFSSHLMQDIEELCSHVVVIDQGRILHSGELQVLQSDNAERFNIRVSHKERPEKDIVVHVSELQTKIDQLRAENFDLIEVKRVHQPLEEVFQALREKGQR